MISQMFRSHTSVRTREVVTRWLQASPATRVGGAIAALLLGISGLFGGLDRVPLADRVDEVKPGTEVTVQPFALTLKRVVVVDEIQDVISPLTDGNHLMVVQLDAENLSNESLGSYLLSPVSRAKSYMNRNVVVLDDRLAPDAPSVYDVDSNVPVSVLSPGLTYDLALVCRNRGTSNASPHDRARTAAPRLPAPDPPRGTSC